MSNRREFGQAERKGVMKVFLHVARHFGHISEGHTLPTVGDAAIMITTPVILASLLFVYCLLSVIRFVVLFDDFATDFRVAVANGIKGVGCFGYDSVEAVICIADKIAHGINRLEAVGQKGVKGICDFGYCLVETRANKILATTAGIKTGIKEICHSGYCLAETQVNKVLTTIADFLATGIAPPTSVEDGDKTPVATFPERVDLMSRLWDADWEYKPRCLELVESDDETPTPRACTTPRPTVISTAMSTPPSTYSSISNLATPLFTSTGDLGLVYVSASPVDDEEEVFQAIKGRNVRAGAPRFFM